MRFGIVGGGRWAAVHRDALATVGADLVNVLVASEASARRVHEKWGVNATTDMARFLAADTEAVVVASPNYLHADHAVACLEAGRHVLVEKPMAISLDGCDRIAAAAARAGKVVGVGLEMRVFTLFSGVRELVSSGAIGRPLHLKLDLWRRPYRAGAGGWKSDPGKLGSSILEEPIHYLDLARWYLAPSHGEPRAVQAWGVSRPGAATAWENLDVRLDFGEAQALVTRSVAAYGHRVQLQLVGEEGAVRAGWEGSMDLDPAPSQTLELKRGQGADATVETVEVPLGGHAFDLPRQAEAFIAAVRTGSRPAATLEDGRASVALCLAVEESLRRGTSVSV